MVFRLPLRLLVLIAAMAGTATVLGFAGEAAARYRERHRATVPGTMQSLFYRHNRLRHALVRGMDYYGWVHVNAQGFRGRDVAVEKPAGRFRIMVVGSSTTFDPAVTADDRTWPSRLEYWLTRLAPTHPVEVINAGVPGYRVLDNLIRLETELYQFRPDLVIFYEGHNDLFAALGQPRAPAPPTATPDEMAVATPWMRWLSRHSLLYNKLVFRWKAIRFARQRPGKADSTGSGVAMSSVSARGEAQFRHDVTVFLATAAALGMKVVQPELVHVSGPDVVAEPDSAVRAAWRRTVPFAPAEWVLTGYMRYNDILREVADRCGAIHVATRLFVPRGAAFYAEGDPIHFNDRGADHMGRGLAEALLSSGVLGWSGASAARQSEVGHPRAERVVMDSGGHIDSGQRPRIGRGRDEAAVERQRCLVAG